MRNSEQAVAMWRFLWIGICCAFVAVSGIGAHADEGNGAAAGTKSGPSGLPLPRFVSLKSSKVNVRNGPSTDQAIVWVFKRAGLPVEIIAESENWRRIRDSEGANGWVLHSLLSGRRTVLIEPWSKERANVPLYASRSTRSSAVAGLEPGVLASVQSCDGKWCEISVDDFSGYVEQVKLWGVYRDEEVE